VNILLDTDVLLDVGLWREPWAKRSKAILDLCEAHVVSGFVAWHTVSNVFYLVRHQAGSDARPYIDGLLRFVEVAQVGHAEMQLALRLDMSDLEDAMQAAAAAACGAGRIVTRNARDFKRSPIPAVTPKGLLREMAKDASR